MYTTKHCDNNFKPLPFWSWNNKLDQKEIREQINGFKAQGMGGFFIHARGGLKTSYMSEEWIGCVRAAVEEAKEIGLKVWLYDEDGWPSGFAGGVIPALGVDYQQKWLCKEEIILREIADFSNTVGLYRKKEDNSMEQIYNINNTEGSEVEQERVIHIYFSTNKYYSDLLYASAVKEFLNSTHEVYYKHFKEEFGNTIIGIFTDEPQFAYGQLPWSVDFAEAFRRLRGYDIVEKLPYLFYGRDTALVHDYWKTVVEMFVNAYSRQIGQWCEEHNINLTGHISNENGLCMQMASNAGVMPHYLYMQLPGIDHLGRKITSPVLVKQVTSIAQQFPDKRVISEMFGCSGWDTSFQDLKWLAEWQFVQGINLSCQHIAAYSLEGCRKRDYPPAFSYQLSWWEKYHKFNDYINRLLENINIGKNVADVLVLHPISSAWCAYHGQGTDTDLLEQLSNEFRRISEYLNELHVDYQFGDELVMAEHGRVRNSKISIGQAEYSLVIIPPSVSMERTTFEMLKNYAQNGGRLLFISPVPYMIEGVGTQEIAELLACKNASKISSKKKYLDNALNSMDYKRQIRIVNEQGQSLPQVLYRHQRTDAYDLFYLFNSNNTEKVWADIILDGDKTVSEFDVLQQEELLLESRCFAEKTIVKKELAPTQSCVLIAKKGIPGTRYNQRQQELSRERSIYLGDSWNLIRMDPNAITLDYCSFSVEGGNWSEQLPVIKVQEKLLEYGKDLTVNLKYNFQLACSEKEITELFLVVEKPEIYDILVNGHPVRYEEAGWWVDKGLKKIDIKKFICKGSNSVDMKARFKNSRYIDEDIFETERNRFFYDTELESIYLTGDFCVDCSRGYSEGFNSTLYSIGNEFKLNRNRALEVNAGVSATEKGLWFYRGRIMLEQSFLVPDNELGSQWVLRMKRPYAALGEVFLNEHYIGDVLCDPVRFELSSYIRPGENKVSIILYSSNRNLLGPHHHYRGEINFVGPSSFKGAKGWEDHDYSDTPEDAWKDGYSFVRLGLNGTVEIEVLKRYLRDQ